MQQILQRYYSKMGKDFVNAFSEIIPAIMSCGNSSGGLIANQMSKINNKSFKTNDMRLHRFLKSSNFQIDEKFWRMHINLLFDILQENNLVNQNNPIDVLVDCTTSCDNFLIMMASIIINGKAVCLYFTSRVYPRRKNRVDYKIMERAFINGLRQILSKKFQYRIIADRGFGNLRFINLCKNSNFGYVVRINKNLRVKDLENNQKNLKEFDQTNIKNLELHVNVWQQNVYIETCTSKGSTWFLVKSSPELNGKEIYEKRFKIEKLFQDSKSSGFNIEANKIKKYDRFKRLLYCCHLSHLFLTLLGNFINNKKNDNLKKNFYPNFENISAFLPLALERCPISTLNLWTYSPNEYLE
jgi:hypothetical protein